MSLSTGELAAYPPPPRADASQASYDAVRDCLQSVGFSESAICEYLRVNRLAELFEGGLPESFETTIGSPIAALCQVFLLGRELRLRDLSHFLGDAFVSAALEVGLLYTANHADSEAVHEESLLASAALYPLENLYLASDRVAKPPRLNVQTPPDVVYPAVTFSAAEFLRLLPRRNTGRFLEACAGCGPAAMLAAGFADSVISADIAGRSVAFSNFNARLNAFGNVNGHQGSFYEGLRHGFDMIAAHPPYMPSDDENLIYYSGGEDGAQILRGLVQDLPSQLNPGGIFFAVALVPSSRKSPVERRLREWLGDAADSFDVFAFPYYRRTLQEMAQSVAEKREGGIAYRFAFRQKLQEMGIEEYDFGAILIRRCRSGEPPVTVRRQITSKTSWRHLMWCVDWEAMCRTAEGLNAFLANSVRARAELELEVSHRVGQEGLEPVSFRLVSRHPFGMESEIQGWMTQIFHRASAAVPLKELHQTLIEDGSLHPQTPIEELARLVAIFVAGGFMETPICPLPAEEE